MTLATDCDVAAVQACLARIITQERQAGAAEEREAVYALLREIADAAEASQHTRPPPGYKRTTVANGLRLAAGAVMRRGRPAQLPQAPPPFDPELEATIRRNVTTYWDADAPRERRVVARHALQALAVEGFKELLFVVDMLRTESSLRAKSSDLWMRETTLLSKPEMDDK